MTGAQDNAAKKVLLLTFHFPPDAAVGALRSQKFAKYLPEFGWQPYALTIKDHYLEKKDPARLADVQGVPIFRTAFFRPPLQSFFLLRDRLFPKKKGGGAQPDATVRSLENKKTFRHLLKSFIGQISYFPDDRAWWLLPALFEGVKIIRRYKIGVIYCTSPPHSVDLIGMVLAKLTGCKLIVDHRDPWSACHTRLEVRPIRSMHRLAEAMVLKRASAIVTTTERYSSELIRLLPEYQDKIFTISNGFDGADFNFTIDRAVDKFVITYVGTFYLERSPAFFLKAVSQLVEEVPELRNKLEINFVGAKGNLDSNSLEHMIEENNLSGLVNVTGLVSYHKSLQYVLKSNLLLLFAPHQPLQIPAKTFEYMAAKIPILAFTEEGATADIIDKYRAGLIVPQDDIAAIKLAIGSVYAHPEGFFAGVNVSELERRSLTQKLAAILDDL
jgi:glycosyltransferase involved in cell wall biosynthesis